VFASRRKGSDATAATTRPTIANAIFALRVTEFLSAVRSPPTF
jgi:hypothetical protein